MDKNLATIELMAMHTKACKLDDTDIFTFLLNKGLPKEIVIRLQKLWKATMKVGAKVIQIGRVIIMKLIEFIRENPTMVIGLVIGAFLGTYVEMSHVALLPDALIDLLNAISFYALTFIGMISGNMKDNSEKSGTPNDSKNMIQGVLALVGDLVGIIKDFLKATIEIILAIKEDIKI